MCVETNLYQKILFLLGLILMLVASFNCYAGPYSEPSIYREGLTVVGGLVLLLGALSISIPQQMPFISVLAMGFMLLFFLQSKSLHYAYGSVPLQSMMYALWCAILGFAACQYRALLGGERFYFWVGRVLLAGGLLAVAIVVWVALHGGTIETEAGTYVVFNIKNGIMSGTLSQANQFSTFLICSLVSVAWVFQTGRFRLYFLFLSGVLLATVIALTHSRTGVLELLALLFGSSVAVFLTRKNINRFALNLLLLCVLALLCQIFVPELAKQFGLVQESVTALSRLTNQKLGAMDHSNVMRVDLWLRAWHMFTEHPLLGVGIGNFAGQDFLERAAGVGQYDQNYYKFTHAHNIVLQVAAEAGIVGLCLLGLFFWKFGMLLVEARKKPVVLYPIAILLCLGLHSMTEFPLWYAFFMGVMILFSLEFPTWPLPERVRRLLTVATSIFLLCIAAWGGGLIYGLYQVEQAYIVSARDKAPERAIFALQSDAGVNGTVAQYVEPFFITETLPNSKINNNKEIAEIAARVVEHSPNVFYVYRLPLWQISAGERDKAYASLTRAYAMHPPGLQSLAEARSMTNDAITRQWIDELLEYAKNNLAPPAEAK